MDGGTKHMGMHVWPLFAAKETLQRCNETQTAVTAVGFYGVQLLHADVPRMYILLNFLPAC